MKKSWTKIILIGVLLLIAIQLFFTGFKQLFGFGNIYYNGIILMSILTIGIGIIFTLLAIFSFLEKRWMFIPQIILLILFLIYIIYTQILAIYLHSLRGINLNLINIQLVIFADYFIFTVIAIILTIKINKK